MKTDREKVAGTGFSPLSRANPSPDWAIRSGLLHAWWSGRDRKGGDGKLRWYQFGTSERNREVSAENALEIASQVRGREEETQWALLDSNQGPVGYEPTALSVELWAPRAHNTFFVPSPFN